MNIFKNIFGADKISKKEVNNIIATFEERDIDKLQQLLFKFYNKLNKRGGGAMITSYPEKDKLCDVFLMCLQYDWMHDSDIREVWAENAFYCSVKYFNSASSSQDKIVALLNLFLTCQYGDRNLHPQFNKIIKLTSMHPLHASIFDDKEYENGADYLIRGFLFFTATFLSPIAKEHSGVIPPTLKNNINKAKTDFVFANIPPQRVIAKMNHISTIIESILNDM